MKVSWDFAPWTSAPGKQLHGVSMSDRMKHVIDCAWISRILSQDRVCDGDSGDAVGKGFWADISESLNRKAWGKMKTLNQSSPSSHAVITSCLL